MSSHMYRCPKEPSSCQSWPGSWRQYIKEDRTAIKCWANRCQYEWIHTHACQVHDKLLFKESSLCAVQICQKIRRIGCVILRCKLQCGITQPILRLFWHICTCKYSCVYYIPAPTLFKYLARRQLYLYRLLLPTKRLNGQKSFYSPTRLLLVVPKFSCYGVWRILGFFPYPTLHSSGHFQFASLIYCYLLTGGGACAAHKMPLWSR